MRFLPIATYIFAGLFALFYAYEVGRSTQHQIDREQIKAAYKSNQAVSEKSKNDSRIGGKKEATEQNTDNGSQQTSEITPFLRILPVGEGGIVIVTLLLAAVTLQLVIDGREHSTRQLRAYVGIEYSEIRIDHRRLLAFVDYKNAGQTPAFD
ncbi:MAG: hypothetical protein ACLPKB_22130, partial [Xanthobacteraceae bacterium]